MPQRLLLFDIDGTLMDTCGAGAAAFIDTAVEVLGIPREDMPPLDLAGAVDRQVVRTLFADTGREHHPERVQCFHQAYLLHLHRRLHAPDYSGVMLPGITPLLQRLQEQHRFHLGLLTGNVRAGAQIKLERYGLAGHFSDGGFGDDAEHRGALGPIAVQRMQQHAQQTFSADKIIVIGDTPKDIACARAIGARCIAVATGHFTAEQLATHQPWQVLPDLTDTEQVLALLGA